MQLPPSVFGCLRLLTRESAGAHGTSHAHWLRSLALDPIKAPGLLGSSHHRQGCAAEVTVEFSKVLLQFSNTSYVLLQLDIRADASGSQRGAVLQHVVCNLVAANALRPLMPDLLTGLDEVRQMGGGGGILRVFACASGCACYRRRSELWWEGRP
jgi:hypothetical protein